MLGIVGPYLGWWRSTWGVSYGPYSSPHVGSMSSGLARNIDQIKPSQSEPAESSRDYYGPLAASRGY